MHATDSEAPFVYKSWLDAGGGFSVIRLEAFEWLHLNVDNADAAFVSKRVAREPNLPTRTVIDILKWCQAFAMGEDALWRLTRLGEHLNNLAVAGELVRTADTVIVPLMMLGNTLEPITRQQILHVLRHLIQHTNRGRSEFRQEVDQIVAIWVRHPQASAIEPGQWLDDIMSNDERRSLFMRIAAMLGQNQLSMTDDYDHLSRFLDFFSTWPPEAQNMCKPIIKRIKRQLPSQLWERLAESAPASDAQGCS